jgi:hypothetical protein
VGGAFIDASEIPAFGTKVTVELDTPELRGFKMPGIVRWAKGDGFGVQFQLLGARETHGLARLVSKGK